MYKKQDRLIDKECIKTFVIFTTPFEMWISEIRTKIFFS